MWIFYVMQYENIVLKNTSNLVVSTVPHDGLAHYCAVAWASWCLKSQICRLFVQQYNPSWQQRKLKRSTLLALCEGNQPVTGVFPYQMAINAGIHGIRQGLFNIKLSNKVYISFINTQITICSWYIIKHRQDGRPLLRSYLTVGVDAIRERKACTAMMGCIECLARHMGWRGSGNLNQYRLRSVSLISIPLVKSKWSNLP